MSPERTGSTALGTTTSARSLWCSRLGLLASHPSSFLSPRVTHAWRLLLTNRVASARSYLPRVGKRIEKRGDSLSCTIRFVILLAPSHPSQVADSVAIWSAFAGGWVFGRSSALLPALSPPLSAGFSIDFSFLRFFFFGVCSRSGATSRAYS